MSRLFSRIVCGILGALGVAPTLGCSGGAEYGMPHASYTIEGAVVESGTSNPIRGIAVTFESGSGSAGYSGADGAFRLGAISFPCGNGCVLEAKDVDGDENGGAFLPATITLSPTQTGPGDGDWSLGAFEQKGVVVRLEKAPRP